jgi:hypothetical protein
MSDTRPTLSASHLAPQANIPTDELMPLNLKYPRGFLTFVHPDNLDLMFQAAANVGTTLKVAVYVPFPLTADPAPLFAEFQRLLVEDAKARGALNESAA